MPSDELLRTLRDVCDSDDISDTSENNLEFVIDVTSCSTGDFEDIISAHRDAPFHFRALQVRSDAGTVLFERSSDQLVVAEEGFEIIAESGVEIDLQHYRGGFDRYRDDDLSRAVEHIQDLGEELADDGIYLEVRGLLDKESIADELIGENFPERIAGSLNPGFWWSPNTLCEWIADNGIDDTTKSLFDYEHCLLLLFVEDAPDHCDVCTAWSALNLDELDVLRVESACERYQGAMKHARETTRWHDALTPIHPDHVLGLRNSIGEEFDSVAIHALLGAFSTAVDLTEEGVEYTISHDPECRSILYPDNIRSSWGSGGVESVIELYKEFNKHEEKDAFRDLWQLAITEQCLEEEAELDSLPELADSIRSANEDLKVSAIEENFDELSDVLEDTQTLMANLTSRLSDAADETSQDVQRLTFSLLGAIVANIFLVLRWSDRSLVPPFSIFVIVILVSFYLPLVQGRINDLDETITQVGKDYDFYEDRIRRFNKDLLHLSGLSERKEGYLSMARGQRNRAQKQLEVVFGSLLFVWVALCAWSSIGFQFGGLMTVSLVTSALVLGVISLSDEERYVSHRGREYFRRDWALVAFCLILGLIALQWAIGAFGPLAENLPSSLPRFATETGPPNQ